MARTRDGLRPGRHGLLEPPEELEPTQRHARHAALLAGRGELTEQQRLDRAPQELGAGERQLKRGQRSSARFSCHDARCSDRSAASSAEP